MTNDEKAILLLWQRVNTSLSAFYKLLNGFKSAAAALEAPTDQWAQLGIHAKHLTRKKDTSKQDDLSFLSSIQIGLDAHQFKLIFANEVDYPVQLNQLFNPPPVLFYRGDISRLISYQIAIVGSRKPTTHAQKVTFEMAQYLAQSGYVITSGLAQGVDAQAHLGALAQPIAQAGRTVGVMGTGIDVCYPKQHQALFDRIVSEGGCIISELLPGTLPNKYTFPRRNRLVAGMSIGTIVTEATVKSGSLITARLTSEQGKQVFAVPSRIDNPNAEGCHHLIREGATLVYHPEQIIADLASQLHAPKIDNEKPSHTDCNDSKNNISNQSVGSTKNNQSSLLVEATESKHTKITTSAKTATANAPKHLQPLLIHLDWIGQDLDALIVKTQLETPTLLGQLMELELMGLATQVTGRYKRL